MPCSRCATSLRHAFYHDVLSPKVVARHRDTVFLSGGARRHDLALTDRHPRVLKATNTLLRLFAAVAVVEPLHVAIEAHEAGWIPPQRLHAWAGEDDLDVIGLRPSSACYIDQPLTAALHLAWKHHDGFTADIIANARVGGDNCHRCTVVGGLLGLALGVPEPWLAELHGPPVHTPAITNETGETRPWK